jgi:hypothetical protein
MPTEATITTSQTLNPVRRSSAANKSQTNNLIEEAIGEALNIYSGGSGIRGDRNGLQKQMSKVSGVRNFTAESMLMSEEREVKKPKRRPHINGKFERRYSQMSLGKELVLSKVSTLKMVWSMETS